MEDNKCVCMECKIHCSCELHKDYENAYCGEGENPISFCLIKEKNGY